MLEFVVFAILFAQGLNPSNDPISGGAGWIGAGLLGSVLAWLLLWHLPRNEAAKDKLIRDLINDCDKHNKEVVAGFLADLQHRDRQAEASIRFLAEQQERHVGILADAIRQELRGKKDFDPTRGGMS